MLDAMSRSQNNTKTEAVTKAVTKVVAVLDMRVPPLLLAAMLMHVLVASGALPCCHARPVTPFGLPLCGPGAASTAMVPHGSLCMALMAGSLVLAIVAARLLVRR